MGNLNEHPLAEDIFDFASDKPTRLLSPSERQTIQSHLAQCKECQALAQDVEVIDQLDREFQAGVIIVLSPEEEQMCEQALAEVLEEIRSRSK